MKSISDHSTVIIVGGGPVGLFLGICLLKAGIDCKILEMRQHPVRDSRSIGIHPVSLDLFDEAGISGPFLQQGLKMCKGIALTEVGAIGEIDFNSLQPPHKYIMICPQNITETILRDEILKLDPEALTYCAEFHQYKEEDDLITVHYFSSDLHHISRCQYLIGCDGIHSQVRQHASIYFSGTEYNDTYMMGDFPDATDFESDAAVFLPKEGLIESFPLPNQQRRWVVKTDQFIKNPEPKMLANLVQQRITYELNSPQNTMISSFKVQQCMAETLVSGNVVLAGDAAHVVSPIGGQGMNLGWIGARRLCTALKDTLAGKEDALHQYSIIQKRTAKIIGRRAEMNMFFGRKQNIPWLRDIILRRMLNKPFRDHTAEMFAMRGLDVSDLFVKN